MTNKANVSSVMLRIVQSFPIVSRGQKESIGNIQGEASRSLPHGDKMETMFAGGSVFDSERYRPFHYLLKTSKQAVEKSSELNLPESAVSVKPSPEPLNEVLTRAECAEILLKLRPSIVDASDRSFLGSCSFDVMDACQEHESEDQTYNNETSSIRCNSSMSVQGADKRRRSSSLDKSKHDQPTKYRRVITEADFERPRRVTRATASIGASSNIH